MGREAYNHESRAAVLTAARVDAREGREPADADKHAQTLT